MVRLDANMNFSFIIYKIQNTKCKDDDGSGGGHNDDNMMTDEWDSIPEAFIKHAFVERLCPRFQVTGTQERGKDRCSPCPQRSYSGGRMVWKE